MAQGRLLGCVAQGSLLGCVAQGRLLGVCGTRKVARSVWHKEGC